MGQKIITLSGAATDVLYSLFFRGALQSGDLPAKSGAAELRELGFAETRHTATEYQKENYFTFLTAEGQEYAIKHLADTRFGKPVDKQYCSAITIGVELDTSDVQKTIDELDEEIRNSDAFNIPSDKPFINDAAIKDGSISAKWAFPKSDLRLMEPFGGVPLHITNVSTKVSLTNEMRDAVIAAVRDSGQFVEKPTGDVQQSVVFMADRFKVTYGASASGEPTTQEKIQQGANAIIEAAKASLARHEAMMADLASAQTAITKSINQAVDDAIANALRPGGAIHRMLHR